MAAAVSTISHPAADDTQHSAAHSRVLALLAFSLLINYVDRGNLSVAAPLLKEEFHLSATQLGVLLSSFFWTYSLFLLVSGWLVHRLNVKWALAGGFFLWSAATAATGVVHSFATLLVVRLALGAGESVSYPACSTILSRYFPEQRRGLANALLIAGMALGPAFGIFAGGLLMARFGWRPFFLVLGLASMIWLVPWLRWNPPSFPGAIPHRHSFSPSMLTILKQRSGWGTCIGLFCVDYILYFLITWLPFYLVRERHLSLGAMARVGGIAYLFMAVSTTLAGWGSDRWIRAGATPTLVRKTVMAGGQICAAVLLAACAVSGPVWSVIFLVLATASWGASCSNTWAITQTLAGPQASGKWTGLENFVGNLAGVVAPAVTGMVVDRTGRFFWAIAITAVITLLGSLSWIFIVGPLKQIEWQMPQSRLTPVVPGL